MTLSCQVEGTKNPVYDIAWYRQRGINGTFKQIKSEESVVKSILVLNDLSKPDGGNYMCKIYRKPLQYSANALVRIIVKGNWDLKFFIIILSVSLHFDFICDKFHQVIEI